MWQILFYFLVLVLSIIMALYIYLTWHFDHWRKRKIPGPKPTPLFGTFPGMVNAKRNFIYDLDEVYRKYKNKAKFVGVFVTRNPQIMILDPEICKEILITNFKSFQDNESSQWMNRKKEPISGSNPFALPSADWKIKRAEIVPALTISRIKGMFSIVEAICQKLTKYLKHQVKKGIFTIDAKDIALHFTGEVVADVGWGIEAGNFIISSDNSTKKDTHFLSMSKQMIAQTFNAFKYFFIAGIFPIIRYMVYVRFFPELTDQYFLKLTNSAIQMRKTAGDSSRQDLLQHMIELQEKKGISVSEIVAHQLTLLFDGFETSATLISHCLLLLARYPEKQQKLRKEIEDYLVSHNNTFEFDELGKLPYLEQCLAETLRIFSPVAFMAKICTQPCELQNNDGITLKLKPGDVCLIALHSIHHDDEYYPQPEQFIPERFAEENGGTKKYKDMGVYMPFGDGPRICLGPKPKVLYGTFPGTINGERNFIYDLDEIYRQFKNKTRFVGVFMTRTPQLMILDPELVKEILITNFKCFQDNESSIRTDRIREPISGSNPFVLPFEEWKVKRAEIVPGVTSSKIKGMFPLIQNICKKFRSYLLEQLQSGNRTINAKEVALKYTGDVVADLIWGIDAENLSTSKDASKNESSVFYMSKKMIAQNFHAFNYYFIARIFPIIRKFFYVRFFPLETDRYFEKLSRSAIELRQAQEVNSRQDFLQYMVELRNKKSITDVELTAHNLTFLFDGFETSATLISHCLLLLARYPLCQQKLRQEIEQYSQINFDDLVKLPYLEQCVAETLRIFTPLPFMAKVCTQTCEFANNDGVSLEIQPGDICLISQHSMHHDEEFFPQPEEFMPERFADENGGSKKFKDMGVYLPFGDGPRICLGMKFALTQAKAAIVEVIKHFELTVNERTRKDNYQSADSFMSGLDGGIFLDIKEFVK